MYKSIENLVGIKFEKVKFYGVNTNGSYDETPKFVDFNGEDYKYDKAETNAIDELYEMFSNCNCYEDAKELILEDKLNHEESGRIYITWCVVWADDTTKTLCWDVRWY